MRPVVSSHEYIVLFHIVDRNIGGIGILYFMVVRASIGSGFSASGFSVVKVCMEKNANSFDS